MSPHLRRRWPAPIDASIIMLSNRRIEAEDARIRAVELWRKNG